MGTGLCLGRSAGAVRDDPDRGDGAILAVLAPGGPLMRFGRTHPVALTLIVIAAVLMMMPLFWVLALSFKANAALMRSEEHTSELQSLMRISYAVFCLKKKTTNTTLLSIQYTYLIKISNKYI